MLPSVVHDVWPHEPDRAVPRGIAAAWAALAAGEPRQAAAELDGLTGSEAALPGVAAARFAIWSQDVNWWPGGTSAVLEADAPPEPAVVPFATLEQWWVGFVLPMSRKVNYLAANARRHPDGLHAPWYREAWRQLDHWQSIAELGEFPPGCAQVALRRADVLRRTGQARLARDELASAAQHAAQADDAAIAVHLLAVGDMLASPHQSPETLGFDLEFRDEPAVVGDAAALAEAMDRFTEARGRRSCARKSPARWVGTAKPPC